MTTGGPDVLNLKQVAARLGVHYMTAYRYVRQGRLPATREGTEWRVAPADLAAFAGSASPAVPRPTTGGGAVAVPKVDWASRLVGPLTSGDEPAAWSIVERYLAAGHEPAAAYVDLIAAALTLVDRTAEEDRLDDACRPIATAVATRLVSRLGGRFRRPGRSRGTVVFGAPSGERHHLPIAIVADLVRLAGYDVLELGPDVPASAFAAATKSARRLVAVGIGVTGIEHLDAASAVIGAVRTVDDSVPIVVGGRAVLNPEVAGVLDADGWAPDGRRAVEVIDAFREDRGRRSRTSRRSDATR